MVFSLERGTAWRTKMVKIVLPGMLEHAGENIFQDFCCLRDAGERFFDLVRGRDLTSSASGQSG
jgi:hypothetical protein